MKKWFVLGGVATSFWDPTQPEKENEFLYANEARSLTVTPFVQTAKTHGHIVEVDEKEAVALNKKNEKNKIVDTEKVNVKANNVLEAAAVKEKEANETLKEAQVKLETANQILDENDLLKKQLKEAQDKLDALAKK